MMLDTTQVDTIPPVPPDTTIQVVYTIDEIDTSVAPQVGDFVRTITGKPFDVERDKFRLNTSQYTVRTAVAADLERIKVVPNPYIISAQWELDAELQSVQFTNLPSECDIHIYTITGERVAMIEHRNETESWEYWDMQSFNRQLIAYGMYIYVVETPAGDTKIGKFAIIK